MPSLLGVAACCSGLQYVAVCCSVYAVSAVQVHSAPGCNTCMDSSKLHLDHIPDQCLSVCVCACVCVCVCVCAVLASHP